MPDGGNANRLPVVGQLVEDSVGANPQRVQAAKLAAERVTGLRLALQQAQRILDSVDQRPAQLQQLAAGSPGEDKPRQGSAGGRSALCQLAAKLGKGRRLAALDLGQARLQRGQGVWVGEDLSGLLQPLILIDRDQRRSRGAVAGDQHVVATVADVAEQAAQVAAQLANGNGPCHRGRVYAIAYTR